MAGVIGCLVGATGVLGCAATRPDGPRFERAIDELTSVEAPPGATLSSVEVLGCDDRAEMAGGYARLSWDRPELSDGEQANAELERVDAWYRERWADRGWHAEVPDEGMAPREATKSVDGRELRAGVDGVTEVGFTVLVVREEGSMCDLSEGG